MLVHLVNENNVIETKVQLSTSISSHEEKYFIVYSLCIHARVTRSLQEYRFFLQNSSAIYQNSDKITFTFHNAVNAISLSFTLICTNQTDESFADEFRI